MAVTSSTSKAHNLNAAMREVKVSVNPFFLFFYVNQSTKQAVIKIIMFTTVFFLCAF